MDNIAQTVVAKAAESNDPIAYILMGVVITIVLLDKLSFWVPKWRGKSGSAHAECGALAVEVSKLTKAVEQLVAVEDHDRDARVKMREQVDDMFQWHKPDNDGEQKWKGAALYRKLVTVEGSMHSLINDMNESFKDLFKQIRNLKL